MKKLLLAGALILTIGSMSFAMESGMANSSYNIYNKTLLDNPELKKTWVTLQEKNLELEIELLNTSPDWKKVKKLNNTIETERARLRIAQAKYARGIQ